MVLLSAWGSAFRARLGRAPGDGGYRGAMPLCSVLPAAASAWPPAGSPRLCLGSGEAPGRGHALRGLRLVQEKLLLSLVLLLTESSFSSLLTLWKGWWELGGCLCNKQDELLIKEGETKML